MAPSSYQAPMRGDKTKPDTQSQTSTSNLSAGQTTVAKLLEGKGNAIYSVRPSDTIHEAVNQLKEQRIGALAVTDDDGTLLGILSERDIVRRMADTPGETLKQQVDALMTREVVTCTPEDYVIDILKRMTEGRFRHIPVMKDNRLCGMITIGDVVNHRLRELEYEALQMKQMIVG